MTASTLNKIIMAEGIHSTMLVLENAELLSLALVLYKPVQYKKQKCITGLLLSYSLCCVSDGGPLYTKGRWREQAMTKGEHSSSYKLLSLLVTSASSR